MDVVVIGGGLSGLSIGASLVQKGAKVIVAERNEIGAGASGNIAGNVVPFISRSDDERAVFYGKAFDHAKSLLSSLEDIDLANCGALQLPSTVKIDKYISENPHTRVDVNDASELCGTTLTSYGVFLKDAFSVSPKKVCHSLSRIIQKSGEVKENFFAEDLKFSDGKWCVKSRHETINCDSVVIANAFECISFKETSWIPTEKVRGELVYTASTDSSEKLRTILCFDGYLVPQISGIHVLGATYDHAFLSSEKSIEREERMRETLLKWAPQLKLGQTVGGRVSFRATTHDRLPYVGPAPDVPFGATDQWFLTSPSNRQTIPGLYISMGHGSRGLLSCIYSGEVLANIICGQTFDAASTTLLSPFRAFLWRGRGGMLPGEKLLSGKVA